MDLVEVDVLEAESRERGVDRGEDMLRDKPASLGPAPIGKYTFVAST